MRVPLVERQAFARARRYLRYSSAALWLAHASALASGVLYVALLVLLGLFADLVISRGQIPSFRDLPHQDQANLSALPAAEVRDYLLAIGVPVADAERVANEPSKRTPRENELLWRGYVAQLFKERVSPAAGEAFRVSALDDENRPALGALSLVARTNAQRFGRVVAWLTGWNAWMWRPSNGFGNSNLRYLVGLFCIALVLLALRTVCRIVMNLAAARAAIEAATRLRRAVYHHTFRLGTLAVKSQGPTEAVAVFTQQVEAVYNGLFTRLTVYFAQPLKFCFILIFALVVNFWLALTFLLFALLVWLIGGRIAASLKQKGREATVQAAQQLRLIEESLMMMRLVKSYLMELFNQARVERQLARYAKAQMKRQFGEALYQPFLVFLGAAAAILLLLAAGVVLLNLQLAIASAVALATALVSLYWPLASWLDHRKIWRKAGTASVRVFEFLDQKSEVGQMVGAEFLPPLAKALEFRNVTLRDAQGKKLLDDVSFVIPAGQRVALAGADDNEKHAIVYLLTRFLDPTHGEIRMDGKDLRWVTLESLRTQIGLVLQNSLIFNDTVANNIGCGDSSFTLPRIIEAAKMAHAHQYIQKLPKGYETPIGEMGHAVPRSVQFLIALARAIVRDPALFIIEEPAAGLTDDLKALLDDSFTRMLPGRTAIFLPHRATTIRNCDRILLFYRGQLGADGDHRQLLAENDLYR
ncbi:MAG TPA: ABC transporter ATP-binding protein, partial [Gemmataceae bacterium]|nr:ABC transporter ATP-binding protein [Gemmataceae bacterium]